MDIGQDTPLFLPAHFFFYPELSAVSLFRVHDVGKNNLTKLGKPAELLAPRISSFLTT